MKKRFLALFLLLTILCGCSKQAATTATLGSTTAPTITTAPGVDCGHLDSDDNGTCDSCQTSLLVVLDFYAINDLHGKFTDGDNHIGVDELTTYLKNKQQEENVILLSAGDMWQGSAESNMTKGLIMTDWMNAMGFAAMALGNHEYDWGEDPVAANAAAAQFPMLAINIYERATDQPVSYCDASVMVEVDGVQIGIIGAMGDCYSSIASDKVEDIYFKTGSQLTALVKEESQLLRSQGADLIIYLIHDGGSGISGSSISDSQLRGYYDVSLSDGYVDLVFEGHSHQRYLVQDSYGDYHMQHKGDNTGGISHAEITINSVTGSYAVTQADLVNTSTYATLADDPLVQQLMDKYADLIEPANQVLGYNKAYRSSDYLCDKIAQLYYELGRQVWGDDYTITLGGGFLSARSPYDLERGDVTYGQLQAIFPFDNDIVLCSVKGSDLLSKFINTSNNRYHIFGNWGNIDRNATYYIVVDTYTATYSPNRLTIVEEYTTGIYARDLLAEWILAGGLE